MFALPLDSVLTTRMPPTSPVEATCVPPSACLSRPTMSTTRISVTDSGIMFTFVRIRSSSVMAVSRGRKATSIGRSAAISALTSSSTRFPKPSGRGSNSKSMRAARGVMLPPVTAVPHSFQMTPQRMCRAVWVRIRSWRRTQSTSPATTVPRSGTAPSRACQASGPCFVTSVTAALSPGQDRVPVS